MVACHLSCTLLSDALPRKNNNNRPLSSSSLFFSAPKPLPLPLPLPLPPRLNSRQALVLLRECTGFKQLKQIHAQILRNGLSHDQLLLTKLFTLCSSFKRMDYATLVFHQIQNPLTFTWNLFIRAHTLDTANHTCHQAALHFYNLMIHRGVPPDEFTFPFVIRACLLSSALGKGKEVHALAVKTGFFDDLFVRNTLMDFYFKCNDPVSGRMVFDKMRNRSIVSWTTMVAGMIGCGQVDAARAVFDRMPVRNVVSWTSMINGYVRNHRPRKAFQLFRRMQLDNTVRPNVFTLVNLLDACTELGDLTMGSSIHTFATKNGFELSAFLGTALIDMYSKCGCIENAVSVFRKMHNKSLATWNAMITSLGVHERGEEALALFADMEKDNVEPDAVTFVGVLCACLQKDMVEEGCTYFRYMKERYGIKPVKEHYVFMAALLCRVGMLNEAYELLNIIPVQPDNEIWRVLLSASRAYDNEELEEVICKHIGELNTTNRYFNWEVG